MLDESFRELKGNDFSAIIQSCNTLLEDLKSTLKGYESLGTRERRLADRIKWDKQKVASLRTRFAHNIQLLELNVSTFNASQQGQIYRMLKDIIRQMGSGVCEAESVSDFVATEESHEEEVWPGVVADLRERGLTENVADEHRDLIVGILRKARGEGSVCGTSIYKPSPIPVIQEELDADTTTSFSDPIFSEDSFHGNHGRDSHTSYDALSMTMSERLHLASDTSRKYLSIFDPIASSIEVEVRQKPNSLRDDVNCARDFWQERHWAECIDRLLRILVAAYLPTHNRPDLSPKLITFLLGVACTYSGDLETARLVFLCLTTEQLTMGPHMTSPPASCMSNRTASEQESEDCGLAAATWLGDVCLMTDRVHDSAFAYSAALEMLKRKGRASEVSSPRHQVRTSSAASDRQEGSPTLPLNRSAIPRAWRPTPVNQHQAIVACELEVANQSLSHVDELRDFVDADQFPIADSIFENVDMVSPPAIILENSSLNPRDLLYPNSYRELASKAPVSEYLKMGDYQSHLACQQVSSSVRSDCSLIEPHERLSSRMSRAGWPLMWNPRFSLFTALHAIEWYHMVTAVSRKSLLSAAKELPAPNEKKNMPDLSLPLDCQETLAPQLREWLQNSHVDCKEFPGELRCRPSAAHQSAWPDVAVFRITITRPKSRFYKKNTKLGASLTDFVMWDGVISKRPTEDVRSTQEIKESMQAFFRRKKTKLDNESVVVKRQNTSESISTHDIITNS